MENNEIKIKLLTPEEVSLKFFAGKKSYAAMVAAARKKQLPHIRIGNRIFFEEHSLKKFFVAQLSVVASADVQSQEANKVKATVAGIKRIE